MNLKFKNALVTGGAGFIGSHLVDALLKKGCNVTVIDNLSTGNLSNLKEVYEHITFYHDDIRNQKILQKVSKNCDVIFHEAALVSVPQSVDDPVDSAMINELGTLNVLEAARQNNVKKVVLASSCAVYGDDPVLPKEEKMVPKPQSPYAVQKLAGEFYARLYSELYNLETVCLRYFNVFGPRQDPSSPYSGVISIFMTKAAQGVNPVIFGDGNQYRDFVFVKDVIRANLLAATSENISGRALNIGTGKFVRIKELWEIISQMAKTRINPEYKPSRPGDILESVADINNAKKNLGFVPDYPFEKGIEATYNYYLTANEHE